LALLNAAAVPIGDFGSTPPSINENKRQTKWPLWFTKYVHSPRFAESQLQPNLLPIKQPTLLSCVLIDWSSLFLQTLNRRFPWLLKTGHHICSCCWNGAGTQQSVW
jgi:hypothetical protein